MLLQCGCCSTLAHHEGKSGQHLWQPTADERIATNHYLCLGFVRSLNI